jgi:HJR/Mrr/RecB family endonuclease
LGRYRWNPAVEDQAVKRAHRIGVKDRVFVRRFLCRDTIEERIEQVLAKKRRLFQDVIDDGRPDASSMGLTEEEIFSLFRISVRPRRRSEESRPPKKWLKNIDWKEFQQIVAIIYERQGYSVQVTGNGPDGGVDVVAERSRKTDYERIFVQCKHQTAAVGRPVCQQLLGAVSANTDVTTGVVFTSASFSREAQLFAHGKRLKLVDGDEFVKLCHELKIAEFASE